MHIDAVEVGYTRQERRLLSFLTSSTLTLIAYLLCYIIYRCEYVEKIDYEIQNVHNAATDVLYTVGLYAPNIYIYDVRL